MHERLRSTEPFVVEGWDWDPVGTVLACRYRQAAWRFTEQFTFPQTAPGPARHASDTPGLAAACDLLAVTAAVSYYKLTAATTVVVEGVGTGDPALDGHWRRYVATLFDEGLREFAVTNALPVPFVPDVVVGAGSRAAAPPTPERPAGTPGDGAGDGRLVVTMGGGRDSLLVAHALRGLHPTLLSVGTKAVVRTQAGALGLPLVELGRRLDPLLLELNAQGHLNGHVPVTAINTAAAVVHAVRTGASRVVLANESSASRPTRVVDGVPVNHQYSKSLGFERLLRATLAGLGVPVAYGSVLRPYGELAISRAVARSLADLPVFVSCNRAFTRAAGPDASWCGACAKCCFVFLGLAAFVAEREPLIDRFGRDLLATDGDIERLEAFLLGPARAFECIGTEGEVAAAVHLAHRGAWSSSAPLGRLAARLRAPSDADLVALLGPEYSDHSDDPDAGALDALLRPLLT